jgi:ABC-type uncharacterized transport system substrate-binding protein
VFALFFTPAPAQGARPDNRMRLALMVGGPFETYAAVFQGLLEGLAERGLIASGDVPAPDRSGDLAPMWAWAHADAGGDRLEFAGDAFYSAGWEQEKRAAVRQRLLDRIRERGDIDCILAFGTWAGQDTATADIDVPVLILSVSNAVEAGIILSPEDSGRDNLLALIEEERYARQIRIFHDSFAFRKLGIVYEETLSGRSSISLAEIERETLSLGAELLHCSDFFDIGDTDAAADRLKNCHERLVRGGADAVYITHNAGLSPGRTADVLAPLTEAFLPTFSQRASAVMRGALMGVSGTYLPDQGRYGASILAAILSGSKPRDLSQRYEGTLGLAVNLETAARIGWNIPLEILAAVDEIYQ